MNSRQLYSDIFEYSYNSPLVISLIGGGGKTSTAFWLAKEFKKRGHRVCVTTTTKMYLPKKNQADNFIKIDNSNLESISQLTKDLSDQSVTFCYQHLIPTNNKIEENKVSGITCDDIEQLKNGSCFTVFIIEADGAKCLPIKAPDRHEPCIPISSDMVIGVTGAEIINTRAIPEKIHRWHLFSALTQCSAGELIDRRILGNLIVHPQGLFKNAPEKARKIWLINKIDLTHDYTSLVKLAQQVLEQANNLDAIWLATMNSHTPIKERLVKQKLPIGN